MGRHVAEAALWIAIASILASFSVHEALDEHGRNIPVIPKFSTGVMMFAVSHLSFSEGNLLMSCYFSHPETFPCRIIPRFPDASVKTLTRLTGLGLSGHVTWEF